MQLAVSFHGGAPSTTDHAHHHDDATVINTILTVDGTTLATALAPNGPTLRELRGFAFARSTGELYVVNAYKKSSAIYVFDPPSADVVGAPHVYSETFATGEPGQLEHPFDIAFGPDGNVYVSNQDPPGAGYVSKFQGPTADAAGGAFLGVFVGDFAAVRGLACDGTHWYVSDAGSKSKPAGVWIYDLTGKATATEPLGVPQPVHLLYDGAQYLYIGSESTDSVYRLDTTAADPVPTVLVDGTGIIDKTSGLALDGTTLFVASRKGRRLFQADLSSDAPTLTPFGPDSLGDEPEFVAVW